MKTRFPLPFLLGLLVLGGCDCAAVGTSSERLSVLSFEIVDTDPPADARGESLVVVPGTHVTLAWTLQDEAERVVLAANDEVLGEWGPGEDPGTFVDECGPARCTTAEPGQVLYTLSAFFGFGGRIADSRSLLVSVAPSALQVHEFRVSPSRLATGGSVELRWATSGAHLVEIEAAPHAGGERKTLAVVELPEAQAGTLRHVVTEPTRFDLAAVAPDGSRVEASTIVAFEDDAYFAEISADPAEVRPGETTTLRWKGVGIQRLAILRDDGEAPILGIFGDEASEGSRVVTVHGPVRFRFVGTAADGEPVEILCDGSGCRPAELEVRPPPRTRVLSFRAEPTSIVLGEQSILRIETVSADALRLLWEEDGVAREQELDPTVDSYPVSPTQNTFYTLHAISQGRVASTAYAFVEVRPRAVLHAPEKVRAGETVWVGWQTAGALAIQLDLDGVPQSVEGLDPAEDGLKLEIPAGLPQGTRLNLVLTALGPHSLETVSRAMTVVGGGD